MCKLCIYLCKSFLFFPSLLSLSLFKGLSKKLEALGKEHGCEEVNGWRKSSIGAHPMWLSGVLSQIMCRMSTSTTMTEIRHYFIPSMYALYSCGWNLKLFLVQIPIAFYWLAEYETNDTFIMFPHNTLACDVYKSYHTVCLWAYLLMTWTSNHFIGIFTASVLICIISSEMQHLEMKCLSFGYYSMQTIWCLNLWQVLSLHVLFRLRLCGQLTTAVVGRVGQPKFSQCFRNGRSTSS